MVSNSRRETGNAGIIITQETDSLALLIRQANPLPNELDTLWALNCRAFEGRTSDYNFADATQKEKFITGLKNISVNPRGRVLVGVVENSIVGMVVLQPTGVPDAGEVIRVRVDPNHRRQGYGQKLMQELEVQAKTLGYKKLILGTGSRLEEANRMYEKLGYRITSRTSMPGLAKKYGIPDYEDIKYEKIL